MIVIIKWIITKYQMNKDHSEIYKSNNIIQQIHDTLNKDGNDINVVPTHSRDERIPIILSLSKNKI